MNNRSPVSPTVIFTVSLNLTVIIKRYSRFDNFLHLSPCSQPLASCLNSCVAKRIAGSLVVVHNLIMLCQCANPKIRRTEM